MSITQFNQIARQTATPDLVVSHQDNQPLALKEPLNPPSTWTKFKAALADVPLLGRIGELRNARAEVDSYPLRLQQYTLSNRQVLSGFMNDLRDTYGPSVANMALRGVNLQDGTPLTQRTVSTVLEGAERAQKQQKALNNLDVSRFLESPLAGGIRLPGETDMHGVFLERDLPLNGTSSWQEALGPGAAKFVTNMIKDLCAGQPDYGKTRIDNAVIAQMAGRALDIYLELAGAPDMTPDKLEGVLMRAADKGKHVEMLKAAREFAIVDRLEIQLDRRNPESMLCQSARRIAQELNLPVPSDAVLKCISRNMIEALSYRAEHMPEAFNCDTDVSSVMRALDQRVPDKVDAAIRQHLQALAQIESSTTLSDTQKTLLRGIAAERRIDPTQVSAYEQMGRSMHTALQGLGACLNGGGDAQRLMGQLRDTLTAFENQVEAMKRHGDTAMWESGSLSGGETTMELMQQFAHMAAGRMTPEQAQELLPLLTGDAMKQLMASMMQSNNMAIAGQYPIILTTLVQAVAERAGETPTDAQALSSQVRDGEPVTLDKLPPSLALALMVHGEDDLDARGVVPGSANGRLIARDFNPGQVFETARQDLLEYVGQDRLEPVSQLPLTTTKDMGRSHFCLNGEVVGKTGQDKGEVMQAFKGHFPEGQEAMARGVARCMNQLGINMFVEACNRAAYGGDKIVGLNQGAQTRHEAWPQEDGSWIVRSTHTQQPLMLSGPEGDVRVETEGVAAFSLTYRVTPGVGENDEASITLVTSQVAYGI